VGDLRERDQLDAASTVLFADVGEAFIFCPECAEREFSD
jgi:hypothetical protein